MNHQWYGDTIGHGSPDAFNTGVMLVQQGGSTSSGAAQEAEKNNLQVQGQFPSGSLGFSTGAGGNFRDLGQVANGTLGKMSGQAFQGDEVVMENESMSGAHPMYERPMMADGPYAAIKTKKGQRVFDDNQPEDEERTRRAEYEDLKIRLESAYRQKVEEVQKVGREVSEHAYARMNQAYMLLQRRSEVDRLQVANESAAMKQCIQDLESQATLKNAVVEYQASTYVETQKLEAQAREAEQQQEVRMFEQRTMMGALIHARGRDVELRSKFETEMAENKQRTDAEARRTIEVEKHRVMFADRLQMQDMQAKVAHYEAMAVQTQKNLDGQNAQAAEELKRISQLALAERDQYCARIDNDVMELRKSMQHAIEQQKKVVIAEIQSQASEALLRQKTSLLDEFQAEGRRAEYDNSSLRVQLEQMHHDMSEMRREMLNGRNQVPLSVGGNPGWPHDNLLLRAQLEEMKRIPLPPSPVLHQNEAFSLGLPQVVPPGPRRAPPALPNGLNTTSSMAAVGNHGGDPPQQWPSSLRSPYDMSELPRPPVSRPPPGASPLFGKFNPGGGGGGGGDDPYGNNGGGPTGWPNDDNDPFGDHYRRPFQGPPGGGPPGGGPPGGGPPGGPPDGNPHLWPMPQRDPLGPKRREADKISLLPMPTIATFRSWKIALRNEVAGASGDPDNGFKWITEVEGQGANLAHLYDSAPFHTLDAKLAASLTKIMTGEFARQIYILMEDSASKGKFLKGRQILLLLYQHYKISEVDGQMLDFQDPLAVHMVGEELRRFMNDWEMTLTGMRRLPEEDVLETLFRRQIQRHPGFREHMAYYERLPVGHEERNYRYLITLVKRYLETRRRNQLRDEASRSVGKAAYVAEDVLRQKGDCYQWLEHGKCASGRDCPFLHDKEKAGRGRSDSPRGSRTGSPRRSFPSGGSPGSNRGSMRGRSDSPRPVPRDNRRHNQTGDVQEQPKSGTDVTKPGNTACHFFAKDGTCKFGDKCRYVHEKDKKVFPVKNDAESEGTSPREESDAEGTSCVAVPLDFHHSFVAFVASVTRKASVHEDLRSILKDTKLKGHGATRAGKRKVSFGQTFGIQFYCDTISKKYAYHAATSSAKPVRWTDVRSEKAAWHLKLAQLIANELCLELFRNSNGLACAVQKELMRWIIDSGSGFDLISGQSLTKYDRRMITKTYNPCRMATANGITTADEQLSVHVHGIDSTVDAVILNNSPCNVLSLGKLCMEKGFGFEWKP